jgi:hypothetical protein
MDSFFSAPVLSPVKVGRKTRRRTAPVLAPAVRLVQIAKECGSDKARVLCREKMLEGSLKSNGWLYVRAERFQGRIPEEGLRIVDAALDEGVPIEGLIVADDLRHPRYQPQRPVVPQSETNIDWGRVALAGLGIAAVTAIALPALAIGGAVFGLLYDPILIACVDDPKEGSLWVALFEWLD